MKRTLLRLLACSTCGGNLGFDSPQEDADVVREGQLACSQCRAKTPIRNGVPRFAGTEDYAAAFGEEWTKWPRAQLDSATGLSESRRKLQDAFTFPISDLRGKAVADIGCGTGRFSEIALEEGAEVVCVDMTRAIDVARRNLEHFEHAHFVQADIFALPLRAEFDVVFSLGVLHHTPDARRAFERIVEPLKPGGVISVRLYAAYNKAYIKTTEFYRRFTKRMRPSMLFKLSHIAIPMYYVNKVPALGPFITRILLPVSVNPPTHAWRVCNTFDLYSPQYQSFHTHAEVNRWFLEAGLRRVQVVDAEGGVCFEGQRPASRGTGQPLTCDERE
jgi:2-polyprenyl-3-methyl-5-hydroxy-6-metoxy-1,4-benzoquinol methylase